jgi:DNA-binding transcriptional ArsR family regulator
MEDKIVLDRKSFEALAVDTRVKILKALQQRRKTLSELSAELNLSVSGVKEHLETLENAALVTKMDDGHKWKYYELTNKGSVVVQPRELKVWILLAISLVALSFAFLYFMNPQIGASTKTEMLKDTGGSSAPLMGAVPTSAPSAARIGNQIPETEDMQATGNVSAYVAIPIPGNNTQNGTNSSNSTVQ